MDIQSAKDRWGKEHTHKNKIQLTLKLEYGRLHKGYSNNKKIYTYIKKRAEENNPSNIKEDKGMEEGF